MTGFVSQAKQFAWGTLTWELRSINHRYLEISFRLPEALRSLESQCRDVIKAKLKRGKLDAVLRWQPGDEMAAAYTVNESALKVLSDSIETVKQYIPDVQVAVTELLRWQGVLQKQEMDQDQSGAAALAMFNDVTDELLRCREREGLTIQHCLSELLADIAHHRQRIVVKMPQLEAEQQARLLERVATAGVELEPGRLQQELLFLLNKQDVAEEMQRLGAHLTEAESIVKEGGVVGRRLDFLMQEFNREANTTASKSSDMAVTKDAVEIKVLIEKIREQVQNIE